MPKLSKHIAKFVDEDIPLDTNGPKDRPLLMLEERTFEAYGFVGINKAKWPKDTSYPDFIVNYMHLSSIGASAGGVQEWVKHNCPKQPGTIVRVQVNVLEVLVVSPLTGG